MPSAQPILGPLHDPLEKLSSTQGSTARCPATAQSGWLLAEGSGSLSKPKLAQGQEVSEERLHKKPCLPGFRSHPAVARERAAGQEAGPSGLTPCQPKPFPST